MSVVIGDGKTMICTRSEVLELLENMAMTIRNSFDRATVKDVGTRLCHRRCIEFDKMITPIGEIADVVMGNCYGSAYYVFNGTKRNNFFYTTEYNEHDSEYENLLGFMHGNCNLPYRETYMVTVNSMHDGLVVSYSPYTAFKPDSGVAHITPITLFDGIAVPKSIQHEIDDLLESARESVEYEEWEGYGERSNSDGCAYMVIAKDEFEKNGFYYAKAMSVVGGNAYCGMPEDATEYIRIVCRVEEVVDEDGDDWETIDFDTENFYE